MRLCTREIIANSGHGFVCDFFSYFWQCNFWREMGWNSSFSLDPRLLVWNIESWREETKEEENIVTLRSHICFISIECIRVKVLSVLSSYKKNVYIFLLVQVFFFLEPILWRIYINLLAIWSWRHLYFNDERIKRLVCFRFHF